MGSVQVLSGVCSSLAGLVASLGSNCKFPLQGVFLTATLLEGYHQIPIHAAQSYEPWCTLM